MRWLCGPWGWEEGGLGEGLSGGLGGLGLYVVHVTEASSPLFDFLRFRLRLQETFFIHDHPSKASGQAKDEGKGSGSNKKQSKAAVL
eukprot:m.17760 g.17760  ORF g.17760 m.17760 type:complete len:87 (+) comp8355_c1_seq1:132-392(+)